MAIVSLEKTIDETLKVIADSAKKAKGKHTGRFAHMQKQQVARLHATGVPIEDIAKIFGCSRHTIYDRLRTAGFNLSGTMRKDIKDSEIIKLRNDGFSVRDIAKQYNCTKDIIYQRLKKHNVQFKPPYIRDDINFMEIYKLYRKGSSIQQLVNLTGCPEQTIRDRFKVMGLKTKEPLFKKLTQKILKMHKQGKSANRISEEIGHSFRLVKLALQTQGIDVSRKYSRTLPIEKICEEYDAGGSLVNLAEKYHTGFATLKREIVLAGHYIFKCKSDRVPKKIKKKILAEYAPDPAHCLTQIAKKYCLGIEVIKHILKEGNVTVKRPYQHDLDYSSICKDYDSGESINSLKKKYGYSSDIIRNRLVAHGRTIRNNKEQVKLDLVKRYAQQAGSNTHR